MAPCDAVVDHAAAPGINALFTGEFLDSSGFGQSAHAGYFDVDDLAAAKLDGSSGIIDTVNAFIQADRCLDGSLQVAVIHDIIGCQRLLNHEKAQFIHFLEEVDISERICGIGINHEHDVAVFYSDSSHVIDIIARFDFAFDTAVALLHVLFNRSKKLVRCIFNAQGNAGFDRILDAESFVFRNAEFLGVQFPESAVDRSARHAVSADPGCMIEEPFRVLEITCIKESRNQVFFDNEESAHCRFFIVPGAHECRAGTISHIAIAVMQFDDGEILCRIQSEAGAERHLEIKTHSADNYFRNFHTFSSLTSILQSLNYTARESGKSAPFILHCPHPGQASLLFSPE